MTGPLVLCLNPWVYDFAAHDFYARPLGLLYLAGLLRASGFRVVCIDCASRPLNGGKPTGKLPKELLPTPAAFRGLPRRYGRYGISPADLKQRLRRLPQPPVAILVTSLMTYWYPGVQATIALAREQFPNVPIILGGIYATLCPEHARRHSGADSVITGSGEANILEILKDITGIDVAPAVHVPDPDNMAYPAWDLLSDHRVLPLLTSRGCPLSCPYCASRLLEPQYRRRRPENVISELVYWRQRFGMAEVAFYDDALLFEAENHLFPILEGVLSRGLLLRFHTPNGMHVGLIDSRMARWLKRANFATLRLGLETTVTGATRPDRKVQSGDLERAVAALREAGYASQEIGVYLLIGLPHQEDAEIVESIRQVRRLGATPVLTQYSPIPHTALWSEAVKVSRYDLEAEPLYHNNSIFPCWPEFSWRRYTCLKNLAMGKV
ncbi:B12-binding domain-containing radical SAM protein [Desulfobacca acetoxidans]